MSTIERTAPVLVTGATGYVAGRLVERLLQEGLTVHAAVRDPDNTEKLQYLNALAEEHPGSIRYFKSDLLATGSYAEAMAGCELVFHTASPFTMSVKDPRRDLVDPAVQGTRNVLETASQTASVKRVVVTSSCAAIYGDNADVQKAPGGVLTEALWNTSSSLTHNPYAFSKVEAEKEAWRLADAQSQWDLVTINPSLVVGPGINPNATSESFNLVRQLGDGTLKSGAPRWGLGVVDVRDVAEAHYQAGFRPEANGRYIVSGHNSDMFEMAQVLRPKFGDRYPLPTRALPKWLLWLVGPLVDKAMTREAIARNVSIAWRADNSRSREELGIAYRPLEASMNEFFQQLVDNKAV